MAGWQPIGTRLPREAAGGGRETQRQLKIEASCDPAVVASAPSCDPCGYRASTTRPENLSGGIEKAGLRKTTVPLPITAAAETRVSGDIDKAW